MATIKLTEGGYTLIPEGTTIFKIMEVDYKEKFGKMEVTMQTQSGLTHKERYTLLDSKGEINEKAIGAFSVFAKNVLNDFSLNEIDHDDLVGHFLQADVTHTEFESNKEPGKMLKSVRLSNYTPSEGFDDASDSTSEVEEDIDDFLNN